MRDWLGVLRERLDSGAAVRVTVAAVRGSAPREPGASMLVHADGEDGTIGGGHLELMATGIARDMLRAPAAPARLDRFPLGASLGQCCGGIVELWFERFDAADSAFLDEALAARTRGDPCLLATSIAPAAQARHRLAGREAVRAAAPALLQEVPGAARAHLHRGGADGDTLYERLDLCYPPLWLFGAGHVGKALVQVLAELPFQLTWVDSRENLFPARVPPGVRVLLTDFPADAVGEAPPGALFLVLTHSHDLDYDICRAILQRGDFAWAGLIGSKTKAARFAQGMRQRGFSAQQIGRLTCPIGIEGIASKLPAAIAVSVAAQVLRAAEALAAVEAAPGMAASTKI